MTVVSAIGRLEGSPVSELLATCRSIDGEFVLDLSGLRSASTEGISAIRELVCGDVTIRGVSPFIRLLLDNHIGGDHVEK